MASNFQFATTPLRATATRMATLKRSDDDDATKLRGRGIEVPRVTLPYGRLGVFVREYDTMRALNKVPVYALADISWSWTPPPPDAGEPAPAPLPAMQYPLGVVATDHAGYCSFDLTPLRSAEVVREFLNRYERPAAVPTGTPLGMRRLQVYPYADEFLGRDALLHGDLGPDFIVLRLDIPANEVAERATGEPLCSMQNPSILDWRLSPGSFSISSALIVGVDGCESFLPQNLSTQQVRFYQVQRRIPAPEEGDQNAVQAARPHGFGYALEYSAEWFPVGHSLGQVLYSLPLAPGEKSKVAIVDWARQDRAERDETTKVAEQLQHEQIRDRTLTESVSAVVTQWQRGGSVMGGTAASVAVPLGPVSLGGAISLGGAYTTSSGTRELAADTTQRISDAIHQATTAVRELRSTVVVQSEQAEQAKAQTRVVANYNHSHALTIMYYEVLRHYRVVTKLVSERPVVLVDYSKREFDFADPIDVTKNRLALERTLLDPRLLPAFDAMEKYASLSRATGAPTIDEGKIQFVFFDIEVDIGEWTSPDGQITAYLLGTAYQNVRELRHAGNPAQRELERKGVSFTAPNRTYVVSGVPHGGSIEWGSIEAIKFGFNPQHGQLGVNGIRVFAYDLNANATKILDWKGDQPFKEAGDLIRPTIQAKGVVYPPPAITKLDAGDRALVERLARHLVNHNSYYSRASWLAEDATARAVRLSSMTVAGRSLLEWVENRPVEVAGYHVAFPINAGEEANAAKAFGFEYRQNLDLLQDYIEQLVSLPTRGVFAEAKLGHCNASEIIDTSRFWDWQTSPIPDSAPEIEGVSLQSRRDAPQGLTPTTLPNPVVNIVNPQSLPDPTGLAGAMQLFSAMGGFRDMSAAKEVGSLLQTLSNNATSLAASQLKARQAQELVDNIRNTKELTPPQRADLIGQVTQGRVQQSQSGAGDAGETTGQTTAPASTTSTSSAGAAPPSRSVSRPPSTSSKPDPSGGRKILMQFLRLDRTVPVKLNHLELVSSRSSEEKWSQTFSNKDIAKGNFEYLADGVPESGSAVFSCLYKVGVMNLAALREAINAEVRSTLDSLGSELHANPVVQAFIKTAELANPNLSLIGYIIKYVHERENKTIGHKLVDKQPKLLNLV